MRLRSTIALHEAGHAVIGVLLGNEVDFVRVDDGEGACGGSGLRSNAESVIATFAGPWAQRLFSDEPPTNAECSEDFRAIDQTLRIVSPFSCPQIMRREELKWESRRMVIANERSIRELADMLVKWGYIGWPATMSATEIIKSILEPTSQAAGKATYEQALREAPRKAPRKAMHDADAKISGGKSSQSPHKD